ncbi:MAG: haloacid dehalogenase-like hydrolase [Anaerolineae bacterium]
MNRMMNTVEYVATDLEGTLTRGEVWRGIGRYLAAHGRANAHRLFIMTHYPGAMLAKAGLMDKQNFKTKWLIDQTRLLAGYTRQEFDALCEWVVEHEEWPQRRAAVIDELAQHHAEGRTILIASGAYEPVVHALARRWGLEHIQVLGTALEYAGERLTGKFAARISMDAVKAERVRECVGSGQLVAAYGDTAADAPMLAMSRNPVAVAPDSALARMAQEKGWRMLDV